MPELLTGMINTIDKFISQAYVLLFKDRSALISVLLHGMVEHKRELERNLLDPQLVITPGILRRLIEYYLEQNYIFVSPQDILAGLEADKRYLMITFDDGYYNNLLSLSVLKEYQVPAIFFISTSHVLENKSFWWDAVYRARRTSGFSIGQIDQECEALKRQKHDAIEKYVLDTFGENALHPISDQDRPFTPAELKSFATEPFVHLGNHTHHHAILTNCADSEIRAEIVDCQDVLFNLTNSRPVIIAYPNGNYSDRVLFIARQAGLQLGVTVHAHKNYLPISLQGTGSLLLNRYILWQDRDIEKQCACFRSDIQVKSTIKTWMRM